jgi:YidC/Oxa1 family membrane protein insertase
MRANPLLSNNGALISRAYARSQFSKTNLLIRNGAGVRFASTTPLSTSAALPIRTTTNPSDAVSSSTAAPSDFTASLDNTATDFASDSLYNIPEHIGYLKSLGLDYGWGPTSMMEWTLEHVHVLAGTPWWVSITLTAILVRAVLFKPYMDAAENGSKLAAIKHITQPITEGMKQAQINRDMDSVMRLKAELNVIHKRAGVKIWKSLVPMLQVFAGYGTFVLLRGMARLPVPGLETGGALWFYNLSLPDPYMLFPAATAAVLHWVLRVCLFSHP